MGVDSKLRIAVLPVQYRPMDLLVLLFSFLNIKTDGLQIAPENVEHFVTFQPVVELSSGDLILVVTERACDFVGELWWSLCSWITVVPNVGHTFSSPRLRIIPLSATKWAKRFLQLNAITGMLYLAIHSP